MRDIKITLMTCIYPIPYIECFYFCYESINKT